MEKTSLLFAVIWLAVAGRAQPAVKGTVPKQYFSMVNTGLYPNKFIVGRHAANATVLVLNHEEQKIVKCKTMNAKIEKDEFASYLVTPVDKILEGGYTTAIINPESDKFSFLNADTVTAVEQRQAIAKIISDSMLLEKKFKATVVPKDAVAGKEDIYKSALGQLKNKTFKAFTVSKDSLTVTVAIFSNEKGSAVILLSGNHCSFVPGLWEYWRINSFAIGNSIYMDFPGSPAGLGDPISKCETANSRVYQINRQEIIPKNNTCF